MKAKPPQFPLPLTWNGEGEPFQLVPETVPDHDRAAREAAQRAADRQAADQLQTQILPQA